MTKPSAIQVLLAKRLGLPATASKTEVCQAALKKMGGNRMAVMSVRGVVEQAERAVQDFQRRAQEIRQTMPVGAARRTAISQASIEAVKAIRETERLLDRSGHDKAIQQELASTPGLEDRIRDLPDVNDLG